MKRWFCRSLGLPYADSREMLSPNKGSSACISQLQPHFLSQAQLGLGLTMTTRVGLHSKCTPPHTHISLPVGQLRDHLLVSPQMRRS